MENRGAAFRQGIRNVLTRNFALGFLVLFSFMFAFFALVPTLPVYLARLGSNEREIGVIVGIFSVASLVSRLLAGGALTKYSEKSVMLFAALLFTVTFLVCIILRPFWPFFAVRLFQGVAYACLDTAVFALIVKVIPLASRARALGYFMLAPALATVMGPTFGMFLVNRFGFTILFLFCTGMSLWAFLSSIMLKGEEIVKTNTEAGGRDIFFLERKIIVPAISTFFYYFTLGSVMAFFPLYAIQWGMKNPGHFFSASALMTIAGRALGGKVMDIWSREKIILAFTFLSMVTLVILSFSKTFPMFIIGGLLWGTGIAFVFPVSMAYALDYAGSSGGTAVGTFRVLTDLGFAAGPMVMGVIIPTVGYRVMFLCLALICLINLCYFQFYVRKKAAHSRTA